MKLNITYKEIESLCLEQYSDDYDDGDFRYDCMKDDELLIAYN